MEVDKFDFDSQEQGNIVVMEHVNLAEPDQLVAMVFYIDGLGLTRDPYTPFNTSVMWVNIGKQQIHVPTTENAQVVSGHIGLLTPSIDLMVERLQNVQNHHLLAGTKFSWKIKDKFKKGLVPDTYSKKVIHVQCPWGNKFRIYEYNKSFGASELGIIYVLQHCPTNSVAAIAEFYQKYFEVPVYLVSAQKTAHVVVGPWQRLIFQENENYQMSDYRGYHVAIYISKFESTYKKFLADNLLFTKHRFMDKCDTLKNALQWNQFRILDLTNNKKEVVLHLEHEVRSLYHPSFGRPLVNRFGNVGIYCNQ